MLGGLVTLSYLLQGLIILAVGLLDVEPTSIFLLLSFSHLTCPYSSSFPTLLSLPKC